MVNETDKPAGLDYLDGPEHPGIRKFLEYWEGKRRGAGVPDRGDIQPKELRDLLPHLIVCEAVDGGQDFRIRLYGTALVEFSGEERTGKLVSEIGDGPISVAAEQLRLRWLKVIEQSYRSGKPVLVKARATSSGRDYIEVHAAAAPLTSGGSDVTQIIGAMFVEVEAVS